MRPNLLQRIYDLEDWIIYGQVRCYPGQVYYELDEPEQENRIEALARAAADYQAALDNAPHPTPVMLPDWNCGCGANLRGTEKVCWRCGAPKRP